MDADMMPDASLDAVVASITKKLGPQNFDADVDGYRREAPDTRERPEDPIDREGAIDLEELEREEREDPQVEGADAKAAAEGEADEEQFIELAADTEGGEAERIPVAEAVEAVKQLRQMNEEIASVVIKAEEEAFAKQDQITQALTKTFSDVKKQADFALRMMREYLPQEPDPRLLQGNADDVADYHRAKLYYDSYVAHANKVWDMLDGAQKGAVELGGHQDAETRRRELDRAARFIPEFKDEAQRKAKIETWAKTLGPKYGLSAEDLSGLDNHKALRMVHDLYEAVKAKTDAPAVRKHVQEKAAKLVKGKLPPRDTNGQFVNRAAKELRETGTEEAFAKKLLASGRLRNL